MKQIFLGSLVLSGLGLVGLPPLAASSGESEFIINASGLHECTRSLWANQYAPVGIGCGDGVGPNNDLVPGVVFYPDAPIDASTCFVNGFPVNRTAYVAARRPGVRGIIHHERGWSQHQSISSSNFFDEGLIESVDTGNDEVTIKLYSNLPSSCVVSAPASFGYGPGTVIKYEGAVTTDVDALVTGRHVRIYAPRPQVVYAFTPAALDLQRAPGGTSDDLGWVRQGIVRGEYAGNVYFAEFRNGEWIDTFAKTPPSDLDGYRLSPEGSSSVVRPGDYLATSARVVAGGVMSNADYGHYLPRDDGSVIGTVVAVGANDLTVRTHTSATGAAADIIESDVVVPLEAGVEYHLDGIDGAAKNDALQVGHRVRILPAIPDGMLCVRDAGAAGLARQELASTPSTNAVVMTNDPLELTINDIAFQQAEAIDVLENDVVEMRVWVYSEGYTETEWFRNGNPIPGSSRSVSDATIISFQEYTQLADDGAEFVCRATTSAGTSASAVITLNVSPDTSPPLLEAANVVDGETILLTFSKPVERGTGPNGAENLSNYAIDQGITLTGAVLIGNRRTVVLNTSPLTPEASYTLTVNNVRDTSETPNMIAPDSTIQAAFQVRFRYYRFTVVDRSSSLAPKLREIRYLEDGVSYGLGKDSTGTDGLETALVHDGLSTTISLSVGSQIITDMGFDPIAAEALFIDLDPQEARQILELTVDASNDLSSWFEVLRYDQMINQDTTLPIDLSDLQPQDILTGAKAAQSIVFPPVPDVPLSQGTISLGAGATSGLPVTYDVISGPATVNAGQLNLTDVGTVEVQASQAGNSEYYSAYPLTRTFDVLASGTDPTAVIGATPISGEVPFTVTFNGSQSGDPDGSIIAYQWLFGDGGSDSGASVAHEFAMPGLYTVTLTVEDDDQNAGTSSFVIAALAPPTEPVAALSADVTEGFTPLTVHFDASASFDPNGTIDAYDWVFGDGATDQTATPTVSHTYTTAGAFNASVTVTDNDLETDSASVLIGLELTVPPEILVHPVDQPVFENAVVTLSVTASGAPAPAYQWKRDGQDIVGANASSYAFTALLADDGAVFTCEVSNPGGTVLSDPATVTVQAYVATPPSFTQQPVNQTVTEGDVAAFVVAVTGAPQPTLQWQRNGADLPGETGGSLSFIATLADDGASFRCVATNTEGSATSNTATLQVDPGSLDFVISVNFGNQTLGGAEAAGAVPATNWNNVAGTSLAGLVDNLGNPTAASVQVSGGQLGIYATADDPGTSADHKMMSGYRGTFKSEPDLTFSVSGLPTVFADSTYDVYVYFGRKLSNDGLYKPFYTIGGTTYALLDSTDSWDGTHDRSVATTHAGANDGDNYVLFEGLSGTSFTLSLSRDLSGQARIGVSGIQIVLNNPPPAILIPVVTPSLAGTTLTLTFQTQDGVTYQLKATGDLGTTFSEEGTPFVGDGGVVAIDVEIPDPDLDGRRFYLFEMSN